MRWEPECGWATLLARWSVAGGAGVFLAVSAAGATGAPGPTEPDVDPQDVRAVEIDPSIRADLARTTEDAARARATEDATETDPPDEDDEDDDAERKSSDED